MKFLETVNGFIWGAPSLIMIIGVGLYITVNTGFVQFTYFPRALKNFFTQFRRRGESHGGVSGYRALCTALAATVGTGNLAGVAGAISIGGPGALFWMWIFALLGMATKFAEAALAVKYRTRNTHGEFVGGPMYMIRMGMGERWGWLAGIYCFLGVVASFGVGNATQINTVTGAVRGMISQMGGDSPGWLNGLIGIALAILLSVLFLGGARRIGAAAEQLVPFAAAGYMVLGALVLILRADKIPGAILQIVMGAFSPSAVTGGALGSAFLALRVGAARGVFTNEAGMGTAAIAHGSANVEHPAEQGLMGIVEVFTDTILICTMTGLVILCSGVPVPYGTDTGIGLTTQAFSSVLGGWVSIPIAAMICCFAIATVLGWGLYGIRCAQYLFGETVWKKFVFLQAVMTVWGAMSNTATVWTLAEIVNGLMAIPNLIVLGYLTPQLRLLLLSYKQAPGAAGSLH